MRTKGSCRFAAYYKIERFDHRIAAWRPIQKTFPSVELAELFAKGTGYDSYRILRIDEKGVELHNQ